MPEGSWKKSARNYHLEGQKLCAELQNAQGGWQSASIFI